MKKNAILLMAVVSLFVSNKQMANAEDNTATQKDSTGISVDSLEKMSDKELESMTQVPVPTATLYGIYNQMQIQQLECITSLIHTKINIIPL